MAEFVTGATSDCKSKAFQIPPNLYTCAKFQLLKPIQTRLRKPQCKQGNHCSLVLTLLAQLKVLCLVPAHLFYFTLLLSRLPSPLLKHTALTLFLLPSPFLYTNSALSCVFLFSTQPTTIWLVSPLSVWWNH